MKNPKKISRVKLKIRILPPDKIAYLLRVVQLTKNKMVENIADKTPINSKLYSTSQIASEGAQIRFSQKR